MAIIVDIYYYDVDAYIDYIGEETADNLKREGFGGIAAHDSKDGHLSGALVWQQKENEENVFGAEFQFYNSVNYEAGLQLLQELFSREDEEGIEKNWFEFTGLFDDVKKTLLDSGFSLKEKESRDLYKTIGEIAGNKAFKIKKIPPYIIPLSKLDPVEFERGIARSLFAGLKLKY